MPFKAGSGVRGLVEGLPGSRGRGLPGRGRGAPRGTRARHHLGSGAHVATGLSPVLIDLMGGDSSPLAQQGGVIHDFELALSGSTSEDVDEALGPGRFGGRNRTALNGAISRERHRGEGLARLSWATSTTRSRPTRT